jgi:16S rRNA (cytidine1402-2'-O)-methyltransferase
MFLSFDMAGTLYIVGTPIGNLKEISLRALEILKSVDVIYCEDTRHSLKLLNHFEIRKPLKSCPQFKEKKSIEELLGRLRGGENIAFISDAGMPGICDPGEYLVRAARDANQRIEIIGGVSALTSFLAGVGVEIESFTFIGFLPPRVIDRKKIFEAGFLQPTVFFESPHRIESTLELLKESYASQRLILAKELSKISETFFEGTADELLTAIKSFKGEWIGMALPAKVER